MTTNRILLLGGLWLDASAWDGVLASLKDAPPGQGGGDTPGRDAAALPGQGDGNAVARDGDDTTPRDAVAVTLPGQGDGNAAATLDDQVAAVLAAVDAEAGPVVVVGHSAACSLAWMAADARPEKVATVVLIGGFPWADGQQYFPFIPPADGAVRFPGWEAFEGPDSADIDADTRAAFAAAAIPVPEGVTGGTVRLGDDRRFDVPIVVVCPEFSPEQARGWIDGGDAPEVARAKHVELVDIDSGHWPMLTRPAELARILAQV